MAPRSNRTISSGSRGKLEEMNDRHAPCLTFYCKIRAWPWPNRIFDVNSSIVNPPYIIFLWGTHPLTHCVRHMCMLPYLAYLQGRLRRPCLARRSRRARCPSWPPCTCRLRRSRRLCGAAKDRIIVKWCEFPIPLVHAKAYNLLRELIT